MKQEATRQAPSRPDIWRNEDFWAVWIGMAILTVGISIYLAAAPANLDARVADLRERMPEKHISDIQIRAVEDYQATDALKSLRGTNLPAAERLWRWVAPPASWRINPLDALWMPQERAVQLAERATAALPSERVLTREMHGRAVVAQAAARQHGFRVPELNAAALDAIRDWREQLDIERRLQKQSRMKPYQRMGYLLGLGLAIISILYPVIRAGGASGFVQGFLLVFGLAVLARLPAHQVQLADSGLSYPICVIVAGLLAGSLLPGAARAGRAVRPGLFLRLGLMLMAAQAVAPQLVRLPGVALITLAMMLVLAALLWLLLPALVERDPLRVGPLLAIDVGVGGHSALLGLGAVAPLRSQALVLVLMLSSLWSWAAIALLPALFRAMDLGDGQLELLLAAMLDPAAADNEIRTTRLGGGMVLTDTMVAAKWTIFALLAVLFAVIARRYQQSGGQNLPTGSPLLLGGGVMLAAGVVSTVYAWQGANWSGVMLERGLFPGWTVPLRDWFFSIALLAYAMRASPRQLMRAAGRGQVVSVYFGGQLLKLLLLLPLIVLLI